MKHFPLFVLLALFPAVLQAQTNKKMEAKVNYSAPSRDYVMIQAGYENWLGAPDSVKTTGIGRALNAYLCYDFPIQKSNFSFAAGIGIGSSNIYFSNQVLTLADTISQIHFIPEGYPAYKKYKLATNYLEAPFELRYFSNKENRNKGFKAAIGLRVGALVNAHTKGKYELYKKPAIDKISTRRYLETWRYALTMRAGYGNFSVYGSYQISNTFKAGSGPENIRPFQVGVCITGL
ncbi:MAG: outer membrane beta-barrel protein [Chitinophagaceae bacterium]